ncbi:hypothetical protein D9M71_288850 [compost metagenome]
MAAGGKHAKGQGVGRQAIAQAVIDAQALEQSKPQRITRFHPVRGHELHQLDNIRLQAGPGVFQQRLYPMELATENQGPGDYQAHIGVLHEYIGGHARPPSQQQAGTAIAQYVVQVGG